MAIDIGEAAIDRAAGYPGQHTVINEGNPANDSGVLKSVEFFTEGAMNWHKIGVFYTTNGNTLKCRSSTGDLGGAGLGWNHVCVALDVQAGDFIGISYGFGSISYDVAGGSGAWWKLGDYCDVDDEEEYSHSAVEIISLFGYSIVAGVTAWRHPGTLANVDRDGKQAWVNPANVEVSDDIYASCDIPAGDYGDWLRCTNLEFTICDVPVGATIDGIEVKIERHGGLSGDSALYLRDAGGQIGDNKADAGWWPAGDGEATYGASDDDWNAGLSDDDVRAATFGIDLSARSPNLFIGGEAFVDCVWIRIHYTAVAVTVGRLVYGGLVNSGLTGGRLTG